MSDIIGPILSNAFRVKDVAQFKAWFARYYFGDGVDLFEEEGSDYLSFGCQDEFCPSAFPRVRDDDNNSEEVDLAVFAAELCKHLADGEILNVVAGCNEKLLYVSFDQLVIAQAHPDKPYYRVRSVGMDTQELLELVAEGSPAG